MKELNFEIRKDAKRIDDMTSAKLEMDNAPCSAGFWYSIEEGLGSDFIELLKDEETKKKCYEAIGILNELESATDDYVNWY